MNQPRILIAVSDRASALELKEMLVMRGYEVADIAVSGGDALTSARANRPELALIDMGLGGRPDGIGTAAEIRDTLDIPVIYLFSGSCDLESAERSRKTLPYGYLRIPAGEGELLASIGAALDRHRTDRTAKETERNFRTVFDQSFHLMGLIDTNGMVLAINLAAKSHLNTFGVDHTEVIGKPFWETPWWNHSPEQQQRLKDAIKRRHRERGAVRGPPPLDRRRCHNCRFLAQAGFRPRIQRDPHACGRQRHHRTEAG
jgi:DNA-binding response OmpR family regulator